MADKNGDDIQSKASIEDAAEAFDRYLERSREELKIQKERAQYSGELVKNMALQNKEQEMVLRKLQQSLDIYKTLTDEAQQESLAKSMTTAAKAAGMAAEQLEELAGVLDAIRNLNGKVVPPELLARLSKLQKGITKAAAAQSEFSDATSDLNRGIKSLVGGLNLGITASSGFASSLLKVVGSVKTLSKAEDGLNITQIAVAMAGEMVIGVMNKVGSEIATMAQEATKGAAAIAKLSGATENSVGRFMEMTQGLYHLGISAESFGNTAGTLINQTSLLGSEISIADQASVRLAAKMVTLGVDAGQLAGTINLLSRNFGMSFAESTKFYESIIVSSRIAGQNVADLSKNFQEAQNRLALTSQGAGEMKKQFFELNKMTKDLGVSMSGLTGVAAGFDKFGDAANKVGKLNAQFNLGLSMTKMMNANDADRVKILRQAFAQRNINISQLGKYEKLHIKGILNAKDDVELMKMLGQGRSRQSQDMKNLNKLLEAQQGAYDKLKNALKEFAAGFAPLISVMTLVVEILAKFIGWVAQLKGVAGFLAYLVIGVGIFKAALFSLTAVLGGFLAVAKKAPVLIEKAGYAMNRTLTAFARVIRALDVGKIMALGFALLLVGGAFAVAGYGFSLLADSIAKMGPEQALSFVLAVSIIVGGMGLLLAVMAGPQGIALLAAMGALGTGILYLGGAIAVAGLGMSLVFNSIGSAAKELSGLAAGSFGALINGIGAIYLMGSPLSAMVEDLKELNSVTDGMDGMVISQSSGGKHTVMMASENILKGKAEGSMDINVKISMDDLNVNNMNQVKVYLDSKELAESVAKRYNGG